MENKKLILLSASGIIIVLLLNYIRYVQYTEGLREDAVKLKRLYYSYDVGLQEKPKSKKDVEKVFSWKKEASGDKELDFNFLKYGYNVKYDSESNESVIYCFGKNKKDDNVVNYDSYSDDFLVKRVRIITLDFFNYYFNKSSDDIIILKFYDFPSLHKPNDDSINKKNNVKKP